MLPELSCDRTPVIISVDEVPDKNRQQYLTNRSTDWNKFSNFMNADTKLNIHLKTDDEIENAAQNLVQHHTCSDQNIYTIPHQN